MMRHDFASSWRAHYVAPGTPYADEPTETVPPGWRIHAGPVPIADDTAAPYVRLYIEHAVDSNDHDVSAEIAQGVVAALRQSDVQPAERCHIVGWWANLLSSVMGRAPRARCGEDLSGSADQPIPSPSTAMCPTCLAA